MVQLSILIPTYRRALRLERCLQSVLASSVTDMEILVADNASPDDTPEVLARIQDPRLKHWRNDSNVGPTQNQLDLLTAAKGKWLFFLTDDDALAPGALERLLSVLDSYPDVGVVMSSLQYVDDNGQLAEIYRQHPVTRQFSAGIDGLLGLIWTAHLLSRLTVRREWVDLEGFRRHLDSLYPQMYLIGAILKEHPGLYLDDCLVLHTTGNETYWEYHKDFMVGGKVTLFKDLLPGAKWQKERKALIAQMIQEIRVHHMPKSASNGGWLAHQQELLKTPEIASAPTYWLSIGRFWIDRIRQKILSAIIKVVRKSPLRVSPSKR